MWIDETIELVRLLINDIDAVSYSSTRLEKMIISSAYQLVGEITFGYDYKVNLFNHEVTPIPNNDKDFINLLSLKAAINILRGETKMLASASITVRDAISTVDFSSAYNNVNEMYNDISQRYEIARTKYQLQTCGSGAVVTPVNTYNITSGEF